MALEEMLESEADPESSAATGSEAGSGPVVRRLRLLRRRRETERPGGAEPRPKQRRPEPPLPPPPAVERKPVVQAIGAGVMILGVLVLGLYVYIYGLSGLTEQRSQSELYKTYAEQLAEATAPTGAPAISEGAPVAILSIPALDIRDMVVVEGTSANDLTHGPGHLPTSPLPGQYGVSVIYGRNTTYGAPFAHLMRLQRGDKITVTTGQGIATYYVESFGNTDHPAPDPTSNRLELITGASTDFPSSWVQVSADLWSPPQSTPTSWPGITAQEQPLAGNPGALLPLVLWSQALLLMSIAASLAARFWSPWAALLCAAPAVLALMWTVYENTSLLLPNLY